jgi:AMP-binding enzyme
MVVRSPFPDVEIPDVSLSDFVLARAGELGDKAALIDAPSGRTITCAQLRESVRVVAAGLDERGFRERRGVRALRSEPARVRGGVPRGGDARRDQHDRQPAADLGGAGASAQRLRSASAGHCAGTGCGGEGRSRRGRRGGDLCLRRGRGRDAVRVAASDGWRAPAVGIEPAEDLVALPYSSGTTGIPKGVMLTHQNLVANICQTTCLFHTSERDRSIAVLPFFHIYGLVVIMNLVLERGPRSSRCRALSCTSFCG